MIKKEIPVRRGLESGDTWILSLGESILCSLTPGQSQAMNVTFAGTAGRHLRPAGFIPARTTKAADFDPQSSKCSPAKPSNVTVPSSTIMTMQDWREIQGWCRTSPTPRLHQGPWHWLFYSLYSLPWTGTEPELQRISGMLPQP